VNDVVLVAVGGNSLIRAGQRGTVREQAENARVTASHLAELAAMGFGLVITHGNGPQVGAQLLRSEAGASQTYSQPLDVCVAATQGEVGYVLQNALRSKLRDKNITLPVVTIVTQVRVEIRDPAFREPTKPVGPFYHKEEAERRHNEFGWHILEDAARGYRRLVPSPKPVEIIEIDAIRRCVQDGIIVIAVGGGGIPVVSENGGIKGVEAVIDKDLSSALLATELAIKTMIISTDVDYVCLNFKTNAQRSLTRLTVDEASAYLKEGRFAEGSMRPKIAAAVEFLSLGGEKVVITSPSHLADAAGGSYGTQIIRGN
jgi:carbamate kinase